MKKFKATNPPPTNKPTDEQIEFSKKLEIPSQFDDRYLINFSLLTDQPKYKHKEVTQEHLQELRKVLHLFFNFVQKKKFNKLIKVKQVMPKEINVLLTIH